MRLFSLFRSNSLASRFSDRSQASGRPEKHTRQQADAVLSDLAVPVLLPIALLALGTVLFRLSDADLRISELAFGNAANPWPWAHAPLCDFIYDFGTMPGMVLGFGGLVVGLAGLVWRRLHSYRQMALFMAAVLAIGPGLLVNGILKPHWRRPRPCQTVNFGGDHAFVGVWGMGTTEPCKSFPCGHASMGFMLMAPAFLLYRRRRRLAVGFVVLGLAAGTALGATRILQGGHYSSDVLWAAGAVYLTGLTLAGGLRLAPSLAARGDEAEPGGAAASNPPAQPEHDSKPWTVACQSSSDRNAA